MSSASRGSYLEFTVPGPPTPENKRQVPPRGAFRGARVDSPAAKDYKALVRLCAAQAMVGREPLEGPLVLTFTAYRERPKSAPKRVTMPATRPDLTNYLKLLEDALNGVVWRDDAQIVEQHSFKRFGTPGLTVSVGPAQDIAATSGEEG